MYTKEIEATGPINGPIAENEVAGVPTRNEDILPVTIYSPDSELRRPVQLLRDMVADLKASRELAWRLLVRDISAQYRQSYFGYAWAFVPPLVMTLTWSLLNSQNIVNIADTGMPYPLYVMIGTLLWDAFAGGFHTGFGVFNAGRAMLARINFPREALILSQIGQVLFNFAIRIGLLIAAFLWFRIMPPATIWLAPLGILAIMLFGMVLGLLIMPLGVLYQDIGRIVGFGLGFWFYLTPVVYPPPQSWPASLLVDLNPVSTLLVTTRELMTTGTVTYPGSFLLISGLTLLLLLVVWVLFHLVMPHLIERMSA